MRRRIYAAARWQRSCWFAPDRGAPTTASGRAALPVSRLFGRSSIQQTSQELGEVSVTSQDLRCACGVGSALDFGIDAGGGRQDRARYTSATRLGDELGTGLPAELINFGGHRPPLQLTVGAPTGRNSRRDRISAPARRGSKTRRCPRSAPCPCGSGRRDRRCAASRGHCGR